MTESILNRFFEKVRGGEPHECWEWQSAIGSRGYGMFWVGGTKRTKFAHRVAWELHNGSEIPESMYVMHSCDNPRCVNPYHLSIGTAKDNKQDSVAKLRHAYGERNRGGGKLTTEQAAAIKQRADGLSITKTAAKYGVSSNTVKRIRSGRLWAQA
jgi:hypothetical protein